jgi:hypothetical protein
MAAVGEAVNRCGYDIKSEPTGVAARYIRLS